MLSATAPLRPNRGPRHPRLGTPAFWIGATIVVVIALAFSGLSHVVRAAAAVPPPPSGGYFTLAPVGSFATLPDDATAAAMVHRSSWEPRPENTTANQTPTPSSFVSLGYSGMRNHDALFGRVSGDFTGTTDEIMQWAAAKWGLPDELLRALAVVESYWYQNRKTASGDPMLGYGYGDFGSCGGSPPPSGYGSSGPASFGILQIKWCTMKDRTADGYDGWPWSENSTAYNLDFASAVLRGCYEGWDSWLGNGYAAGDLMGCVGRWYAGAWHNSAAETYITRVNDAYAAKVWLSWTDHGTGETTTTTTTASTTTSTSTTTTSSTTSTSTTSTTTTTAPTTTTTSTTTTTTRPPTTTIARDVTPPEVTIISPDDGSIVSRFTRIDASATDDVEVTGMELTIDGVLVATSSSESLSYRWSTRRVPRGVHTITVTARDAAGNVGSQSVSVYR